MDWKILFLGQLGDDKTCAIKTISDIPVVNTEAIAADDVSLLKTNTTVAMDFGFINLEKNDKIILYGAPGQGRFDFMWEILINQTKALVLLIDHSRENNIKILDYYINKLREICGKEIPPLVLGITHTDISENNNLNNCRHYLKINAPDFWGNRIPIFKIDARKKQDIKQILMAITSMLDFAKRYPKIK